MLRVLLRMLRARGVLLLLAASEPAAQRARGWACWRQSAVGGGAGRAARRLRPPSRGGACRSAVAAPSAVARCCAVALPWRTPPRPVPARRPVAAARRIAGRCAAVLLIRCLVSALEAALLLLRGLRGPAALARAARVAAAAGVAAAWVAGGSPLWRRRLAALHLPPALRLPPALCLTADGPLLVLRRHVREPLLQLRLRLRGRRLSLL